MAGIWRGTEGGDLGGGGGSRCDPTSSPAEGAAARRRASSPRSPIQPHPGPASPRLRRPRAPPGRDLPAEPPPLEGSSREGSAVLPPPSQSPAGWVGGFHPRPVPRSHGFCGVRRTPGTTAAQRSISALRHPSRTEIRRLFPPPTPQDRQRGQQTPPPHPVAMRFVPSERRGGSQRTPGPLGCSGGIGVSTALGRSGTQPASPLLERLHQRPPVLSSNRTAGSAADTAQKSEGSAQPQGSRHSSVPTPSLWRRQRFCGCPPTAGRGHSGNQPKHPWKQPTQRAAKSLWHPRFGPVILWNPRGAAGWGHPCPCPTKGIHCLSGSLWVRSEMPQTE